MLAAVFATSMARAYAQTPAIAITLAVDAREATHGSGVLHVHETIPATGGPLTLVYPKWIPGEHAPSGPIANLAALVIKANGQTLAWTRDLVDPYAFHIDVPANASSLDVTFDTLGTDGALYSAGRLASPNLLSLTWHKVVLTPAVANYATVEMTPSLTLPGADWQFGTALEVASVQGATVNFKPVTEETLIDSPLDAGLNAKKFSLGTFNGAPVEMDVFADTPTELAASDATIGKFRNLVQEMRALYGARHFAHYTFLLTVSDVLPTEGVEHHESSDDGSTGDFLINAAALAKDADLLPHEFNHSWDGKFRRGFDLATPNLQVPMQDELLWVYEGMTQLYGDLQAERSGLLTKQQWLDLLASSYAVLDSTPGRSTRSILDTATSGTFLYGASDEWASARRPVDFYSEGELAWLEADILIRKLSGGKRSIDDFSRAFFGRTDTAAQVVTYHRDDVIAGLNAVQPYDWNSFFAKRIDAIAPHPPNPFEPAGWRLTYESDPNVFERLVADRLHLFNARYSLGIIGRVDGTITDVIPGSPAARAGLGPNVKIIGVNGRSFDGSPQGALDDALKAAQHGGPSVHLLVLGGAEYHDITLDYHDGPRFPHLTRISGTPDVLSAVAAPRRPTP